jgi:hypothetical protein
LASKDDLPIAFGIVSISATVCQANRPISLSTARHARLPKSHGAIEQSDGIPDYTIRADSRRSAPLEGLPALSCVADFTQGGQPAAEYLVWIRSEKITALFFGRASPGEFDNFRERFDRVIETAKIP